MLWSELGLELGFPCGVLCSTRGLNEEMGNTQTRRPVTSNGRRRRPNSIAIDKPIETLSSETSGKRELRRSSSQNSFRRRYTECGSYSYKTPWPAPMSEVVFWPEYDSRPPVRFTDFEVRLSIYLQSHVLILISKQILEFFPLISRSFIYKYHYS